MFNIISADLYKLKKSKVLLWIILGLLGIVLLGNILAQSGDGIMTLMSDTMNYNTIHFKKNGTEIMPELLKGSNILIFFLIPIVINVFISDYKYETIKNTVSFQYPRTMIYISKMLVCSLFAIIIPFLYVILGLIVNLAFNGFNNIKLADVLITIKIVCAQLPIYSNRTANNHIEQQNNDLHLLFLIVPSEDVLESFPVQNFCRFPILPQWQNNSFFDFVSICYIIYFFYCK